MSDSVLDVKRINQILNETIDTIEKNREEIFEITEHARRECKNIEEELEKVKTRVNEVVDEVDNLEVEDKKSRMKLANVSKNFQVYNEEAIRKAYEKANDLRVLLTLKREEERTLIEKKRELEIRYKEALIVLEKAENINKQVGVAIEYLKGNLDDILVAVDDLSKKQYLGIKIIEAQEEERQRLARDMHDGPAQSMANILVKAELCERLIDSDKDRAKYELVNLKDIAKGNLKSIRKIIYDLRPMSLDDLGLVPTLERYIYNFERESGIDVNLNTVGDMNKVESVIKIAVFRIMQESLNNIEKHSHAKNVDIKIEKTLTRLNLIVDDDGDGFDISRNPIDRDLHSGGFGLISMKERAELLNGKFKVTSSPGLGTKVYLSIPLSEEENVHEGE